MGGIAIAGAVGLGVVVGGGGTYPWPVWAGAALLFGLGLADDLWDVRPDAKVLAQVGATIGVLYAGYEFWQGGPGWISMPLTFLWVIGVTNAFNLIDGIDGLAASVAAVAGGSLLFMSLALGTSGLAVVMGALVGGVLGFLLYNAPPASIFMGDCGSLVLGYLLAVGALSVQGSGGPVGGTLVPIAVLAIPIFDTTFVTVTRLLRGQSVTEGGTDHVHHRLIQLGASEGQALTVLTGVSAGFGGLALSTLWMNVPLVVAAAALCLVTAGVLGVYLATMGGDAALEAASSPSGTTERIGAFMRLFFGGASWKSVAGVLADLLVVGAAFVVALHLRYGGAPPPDWAALTVQVLPGIIGTKLLVFYVFGLYEGIWRHAGTPEVVRLAVASVVASLLVGSGLAVLAEIQAEALSIFILDGLITVIGVGGARLAFRALRQYAAAGRGGGRPVLLYGSETDGILLLRHLRHHPELDRTVVGLLDDDPARHGHRTQGVEVLGGPDDLPRLCSRHDVEEVIIPVQATPSDERRHVREQCRAAGVECQYFDPTLQPASATDRPSPPGDGARDEMPLSS